MASINKEFRFEAAHRLHNHGGKCAHLHGHSYRVIVTVTGLIKPADGAPDEGMVMDFSDVKEQWGLIEGFLDHRDLNKTIGPDIGPTTAENIAVWILARMRCASAITVYETATSSVTVDR
jgi:6-pyruvoyltetrahydropterin/6-carboxytetrahydropterin synthase